ncbi:MAG: tetratricopeptide repeat protein [Verrucomicrobiota bacterium]|nr:tetratricopeptide repeat protein [Verrucomicrobiota bacterium]
MLEPTPAPHNQRDRLMAVLQREWPRFLLLAAIGLLVRLPALSGQFIWDDTYLISGNPFIKSPLLALEAFRHHLFLDSLSPHYRPVQNISFMVDYFFWNTDPAGYHLTNILLHVASGLLLYQLLRCLLLSANGWLKTTATASFTKRIVPFVVALLWMVHPVHSAAVDYISGRADSLAFLFACASWLLVIKSRTVRARWLRFAAIAAALLSGFLAICSREIALIWIVLFLVDSLLLRPSNWRTKAATVAACALLLFSYATVRNLAEHRSNAGPEPWPVSLRAVMMLRSLGDYGRLMVFPSNLHMERTVFYSENFTARDDWRYSGSSEYLSLLGTLVAAVLLFGCLKPGDGQRLRVAGTIWFAVGYLPISNIVKLNATCAEHWLYLPSVGLLLFAAGCVVAMPRRVQQSFAVAVMLAVVGLSVRSWIRSTDWQDDTTFYRRTCAAGGISARVAVNLARAYGIKGDLAKAEQTLRRIVAISPDYPVARNNLADILTREGKTKEAEVLFARLTEQAAENRKNYPRTWIAIYNLAAARSKTNQSKDAIAILDRARADYPQVWELISLEAELMRRDNRPQDGLRLVDDFVQRNWWHHAARLAQGKLYAAANDYPHAVEALRYAALLDVHDVEALDVLTELYARRHQFADAVATQKRAVARDPYEPRQYILLAEMLEKSGRGKDATAAREQVSRLQTLAQTVPAVAAN